jgi:hypothetical protein
MDDLEEQCFRGQVTEITDGYARIHLDGLSKADDVWMAIDSPKLYLDGGPWTEDEDEETSDLPPLHYWQVMDSKRRCKES